MAVNPMLAAGVNGMQNGLRGMAEVAHDVANLNDSSSDAMSSNSTWLSADQGINLDNHGDVAEAMVELKVYQRQVQASSKVVQTADQMMGFLLDTL